MEKRLKNKNITLALSLFMGIITVSFTHNISCMDSNFLNDSQEETENTVEQNTNQSELIFPEINTIEKIQSINSNKEQLSFPDKNILDEENQQSLNDLEIEDNDLTHFPKNFSQKFITNEYLEPNSNFFTFHNDNKRLIAYPPKIRTNKKKVEREIYDTFKSDKEKYKKLDLILYTFNDDNETRNTFKNNNEIQYFKTTYGENIKKYIATQVLKINSAIIEKNLKELKTIIKVIEKIDKIEKKPLLIKILNTYQTHDSDSKPINKAIHVENIEIIQLLLNKGAKVNNYTVRKIAISKIGILKCFIEKYNINLNSKNKSGQTPICKAALYGKFTNFKHLKKNGAKTSIIDNYGNNILHFAAKSESPSLIKYT